MKWANFLHIYQPAEQQRDILDAIIAQSYRPIFEHLKNNKKIRLTFNINGALLEIFDKYGHTDLIDMLREAGADGRIEFTSSAKYHAFLPFLNPKEIKRQIQSNDETNSFYLGESYKPKGFFPPEMAYKKEVAKVVDELGFKWIILDEIALTGTPGQVDYTHEYKIKDTNLEVFFRERRLSNLIMSAVVRSQETLKEAIKDDLKTDRYALTGMDGETFGHHRPGLEKMLFEVWESPFCELVSISDLMGKYPPVEEVEPIKSTWASSKADIDKDIQFLSWSDPENMIHKWQWELVDLVLGEFYKLSPDVTGYGDLRKRMDLSLASDQFFWASAKPWWSVEMIEDGAYRLMETMRMIPGVQPEKLERASKLYEHIVSTGFSWQRSGKIREMYLSRDSILRIPLIDRTLGVPGKESEFQAFLDMMLVLEKTATEKREYEKAILWRDAIYKLKNKLDIYDTINIIDLLRVQIPNEKVEKVLAQYKEEYNKIRGGQPEQRGA